MRVALGEITNTAGHGRREASKKSRATEPRALAPEVAALAECAGRLQEVWEESRARNSCNYLFRHFAPSACLYPSGELPPREVLQSAWDEASGSDAEEEARCSERLQPPDSKPRRPREAFDIFEDDLPEQASNFRIFDEGTASPATPQRGHLHSSVWRSPPSTSKTGEPSPSPAVSARVAEPTFFEDGATSEEEPLCWNDKELCEKELENRLMGMLQQEQEESWLQELETASTLELAQSLNAGPCPPGTTPPASPRLSMYRTPPRQRRRNDVIQAGTCSGMPCPDLAEQEQKGTPAADIDQAMVGVTKGLLRRLHETAERHRPDPNAVLAQIGSEERVLAVDWLLETCYAMNFQEVAAFTAVACLDRYVSLLRSPMRVGEIQVLVLAAVSVALKLHGMSQVSVSLREVLLHLGQGAIPVETILISERQVLEALDFEISTPTAMEMLGLVASRCKVPPPQDQLVWSLAEFLLHLALREVHTLYAYPSSVLAIAATLLAWSRAEVKPSPEDLRVLLRCFRTSVQSLQGPARALAFGGAPLDGRFHHRI